MTGVGFSSFGDAVALVGEMHAAFDALVHGEYGKLTTDQLLDVGRDLEVLSRRLWAAQVHLVDELDQTGAAASRSVSSTQALVRDVFGVSPGEAGLRVAAARSMLPQGLTSGGEVPARRPQLRAVVDAGQVEGDHVRTVLDTLRRLPDDLQPEVAEVAEATLVDYAVAHGPAEFRRIARHLEAVLNPDGVLPNDPAARAKVEFSIGRRSIATGLTSINGWLDDLGVAQVRAVIDPLAAPRPEVGGIKDLRSAATRRAHALLEALGFVADHGDAVLPDAGGDRPHVTVQLDWDSIREQAARATVDGHLLSPGDARLLLCDAQVIPVVLRGRSEVLDVGRASRTFPTAIRRALTVRDRGCIWPGCDRPPSWCAGHHVRWWQRDLGTTSKDNGVLLCRYHHSEIHRSEWEIRFAADGIPELIPPKWLDPKQRPRRNTLHHINPIQRT